MSFLPSHSTFKKKAPRAIREIKKFAAKLMGTSQVVVDSNLNKWVWHRGVRNVPGRVRVRIERQRNTDEEAAEKMITVVTHEGVDEGGYKNLVTEKVA